MARTKRQSTDTVTFHQQTSSVSWPRNTPIPSDEASAQRVQELYAEIIAGRAATDWSPAELTLAAKLASTIELVEQAEAAVREGGLITEGTGSKGQPIQKANPMIDVLLRLQNSVATMVTKLSVTVASKGVDRASLSNAASKRPAFVDTTPSSIPRKWSDR